MTLVQPQAGKASAVGMAIEAAFNVPPITLASGSAYTIGATNSPHRFRALMPGGGMPGEPVYDNAEDEIDGSFENVRAVHVANEYKGKYEQRVDPENAFGPTLGLLSFDTQTTLQAADTTHSVGAFQHNMQFDSTLGRSPSFTIEEKLGNGSSGRVRSGCLVETIEWTFDETLKMAYDLHAHGGVPNYYPASGVDTLYDFTSSQILIPARLGGNGTKTWAVTAAPAFCDVAEQQLADGPLVLKGMTFGTLAAAASNSNFGSAFVVIDGTPTAASITKGSTIKCVRNMEAYQIWGSGFDPGCTCADAFVVTGKLNILWNGNIYEQSALARATMGLNFRLVGALIGGAGGANVNYAMEWWLPNTQIRKTGTTITNKALTVGLEFQAIIDPTLAYSLQHQIVNSLNSSAWNGLQSTSPGGLGGWVA